MTAATIATRFDHLLPPVSNVRAERGRAWVAEHGLPTVRDEAWHYTPVPVIERALCAAVPSVRAGAPSADVIDALAGDHGGPRIVFVNGAAVGHVAGDSLAVDGLWFGNRDGLRSRPPSPRGQEDQPADGFHALNWAAGRDVAAIVVDPGVDVAVPVHVVHLSAPGQTLTAHHPRTVVVAGAGSRLELIESFVGLPGEIVTNASTRIIVAESSTVTYHRIQNESGDAFHVGRTAIEQAAGSTVRVTSIMSGATVARSAVALTFTGPDATADVAGLYLPAGHQRHDNVVRVDHAASRCTSTQRFKGIVDGHARGSFSGHVIVRDATTGTVAHQSNRNLLLRDTAQADTRPWLEIESDDVRCTHGATVGRLDDDALFYLRSRGIPVAEARDLLVTAFAADIVSGITLPSLRARVEAAFAARAHGPAV